MSGPIISKNTVTPFLLLTQGHQEPEWPGESLSFQFNWIHVMLLVPPNRSTGTKTSRLPEHKIVGTESKMLLVDHWGSIEWYYSHFFPLILCSMNPSSRRNYHNLNTESEHIQWLCPSPSGYCYLPGHSCVFKWPFHHFVKSAALVASHASLPLWAPCSWVHWAVTGMARKRSWLPSTKQTALLTCWHSRLHSEVSSLHLKSCLCSSSPDVCITNFPIMLFASPQLFIQTTGNALCVTV